MILRLPANNIATLFAASDTNGAYWEVGVANATPSPYVAVVSGASAVVGPFSVEKHYEVQNLSIMLVTEAPFVVSEEANVAELTALSVGADIATAVNGILAILVANGLMAAPAEE